MENVTVDMNEAQAIRRITAHSGLSRTYLKDLWESRALIIMLIGRDVRIRYKQTILGIGWVVLQPLMTVLMYSLVFGFIARMPSGKLPYPVFLLAALLPWQFVSRLALEGSQCVSANSNLVGKVYFPRLVLPLTVVGSALVDLLVGLTIAVVAMAFFGYFPSVRIVALPFIIAFSAFTGLAAALVVAPLDVNYRDFRMLMPMGVQMLLFVSPILYDASAVPERLRWLYDINPIAVMASGVRWSLLGEQWSPNFVTVAASMALVSLFFCVGLWRFVGAEVRFADRL